MTIHTPYRRKRRYLAPAWLAITAVILLLFSGAVSALDSSCNTIIVGQKTAYHFTITDGPAGGTVIFTISQTNPGVEVFSLTNEEFYSETINISVTCDSTGRGRGDFYGQASRTGVTRVSACSPQWQAGGCVRWAEQTVIACSCPAIPIKP